MRTRKERVDALSWLSLGIDQRRRIEAPVQRSIRSTHEFLVAPCEKWESLARTDASHVRNIEKHRGTITEINGGRQDNRQERDILGVLAVVRPPGGGGSEKCGM